MAEFGRVEFERVEFEKVELEKVERFIVMSGFVKIDKREASGCGPVYFRFSEFPVLSRQVRSRPVRMTHGSSSFNLVLRRVRPNDAAAITEISFYDGLPAAGEQEAVEMLERIEADHEAGNSVHWGICLGRGDGVGAGNPDAGSDEVVGTCGFYRGFADNVGEIGYVMRPGFRGRGIMTAALELVVDFGLDEMQLDQIVAYTQATNLASIAVLERLGFEEAPASQSGLKFVRGPD